MACLGTPISASAAAAEVKTRHFEGGTLEYHLKIENNPRVTYDGQAFAGSQNGQRVYTVLLNWAFFEREGKEIFDRLAKAGKGSLPAEPYSGIVEADLLPLGHIPAAALRDLQIRLENAAWRDLHARCIAAGSSPREARRAFVQAFIRQRLNTIEEHEVSHLIDLARGGDENSPAFARETELKAFYAELARGENPLDSMSQAVAGLLDEARRGRTVDYSREKVAAVLRFLRENPKQGLGQPTLSRENSSPSWSAETLAVAGKWLLAEDGRREAASL